MAKKRLGIGMVGGGFIAHFHIQSWVGVRNADIMGVVSRTKKSAQETADLARKLDVGKPKVFNSVAEMTADPDIDAIWITSPNFTRLEVMEEIADVVISGKGKLIGVACEKPLGRNVAEAAKMVEWVKKAALLDGYLENQVFAPSIVKGRDIIWGRGAATTGRPYLARTSEEHSGPHNYWFWEGALQGGGVLNDMMCHSVESARFLLTEPSAERSSLTPIKITAHTNILKWQLAEYRKQLDSRFGGKLDYKNRPSEDYARAVIEYRDRNGKTIIAETTTSWSFIGAGLRLGMELLGPEYSLSIDTLNSDLKLFFSRKVQGKAGEDLVEKQNAEVGLMPVVVDEEKVYGYEAENRHMIKAFLNNERPRENFEDGLNVTELLMTAYMSAEQEKTITFPPANLHSFIPAVAKGEWKP